jgi:IS30 family transposase
MQARLRYQQLQPEDRVTIASMCQRGCSVRAMARTLQRVPSTVTRELERNKLAGVPYGSHLAQQAWPRTSARCASSRQARCRWCCLARGPDLA